jgi:uncharacterized protein YjbI with pentapeptide repeats
MPQSEHFDVLKRGVDVWNQWRDAHPEIEPDLAGADLGGLKLNEANFSDTDLRKTDLTNADFRGANLVRADIRGTNINRASFNLAKLSEANFSEAYIRESDLSETDLRKAYFIRTDLVRVDLWEANLHKADFRWAYLIGADLKWANMTRADLRWAYLSEVNLGDTDLKRANLTKANLIKTDLSQANLEDVTLAWTYFGDLDLSAAKALNTARHFGPSSIGIDTVYRSRGKIPEEFLHGAGVSDSFIHNMQLLNDNALAYHNCFISYAEKDRAFAQKLHADLRKEGVRCWFAAEDMKIGDATWDSIYHFIRMREKILLVLSKSSMAGNWIENEVIAALEEENRRKTPILFPICLDWTVMNTDQAWVEYIAKTRNIFDFSKWQDAEVYRQSLEWLLGDLKIAA